MAELLGRENGILGGKGGSMHLTDVSKGMMGSYAIIGAHLCTANGAAWSAQMRGTDQVAVAFFGDGTTNIGAFHEALNMAKVWNLPVVFVCENNLYMEYTPIDVVTAVDASGGGPGGRLRPGARSLIDGNDPDAVYLAADAALGRARDGRRPVDDRGRSPIAPAATPAPTPASTGPPKRSRRGPNAIPIPLYRARLLTLGVAEERLDEIRDEVAAHDRRGDRVREGRRRAR